MLTKQQANILLQNLKTEEGTPLTLDDHNDCTLISDEQRLIYFHYDDERQEIQFCSVIDTLPSDEEKRAQILKKFMRANFMWFDSLGSTFAVEPQNNFLMLQKNYRDGSALESNFKSTITQFETEIEFWQERFSDNPEEIEIPTIPATYNLLWV
ncbi:MAG: type III secretion system chaperone [Desulfovibrionaceae bacterium]|nr:type III secretion system chaperone [Desulfovibrionaceae bacterium]